MLTAPRVIASLPLRPKNILAIDASINSVFSLKKHEPYLSIAPNMLRSPRDLIKTIKRVGIIEKPIVILMTLDIKVLSWLLGLAQLTTYLKLTVNVIGYYSERIKIWIKSPITIIIRRDILLTSALSSISQKTSIGFSNSHVGDWC